MPTSRAKWGREVPGNQHVVVLGGGASGTSAAYSLNQLGYRTTILEASSQLGGRMASRTTAQGTYELGAGFMTSAYRQTWQILRKLGLGNNRYTRRSQSSFVRAGRAARLSLGGLVLQGQPISRAAQLQLLGQFLPTLVRWPTMDFCAPWRASPSQCRLLTDSFTGSAGQEALEYFIQPIFDGYCYWDAHTAARYSLDLLFALIAGQTYILPDGLQTIPTRLAATSAVQLNHRVIGLEPQANGTYEIIAEHQGKDVRIAADAAICALPAPLARQLNLPLSPLDQAVIKSGEYSATAVVAQTFAPDGRTHNEAFAFARADHQPLAAITVARTAGQIVVKHFANGQIGPQLLQHDDDSIKRTLLSASPLAAQATPPLTTVVQRWPTAVPSFSPQHLQNLAARHAQPQPGRLALAGDYLVAPCIEGAVRSGQAAAAAVHAALRHF